MTTLAKIRYDLVSESQGNWEFVAAQNRNLTISPELRRQGIDQFNWVKYPVAIKTEERKSIALFDHLKKTFSVEHPLKPSQLISIPLTERTILIQILDDEFETAINNYATALKQASQKDMDILEKMQPPKIKANIGGGILGFAAGFALGVYCPPLRIASIVGRIAYGVIGGASARGTTNYIGNAIIIRECSPHRLAWLQQVSTLENVRLTQIHEQIAARCQVLAENLQDLQEEGLFNREYQKEISQLHLLHQTIFPNQQLKLENIDIQQFIQISWEIS